LSARNIDKRIPEYEEIKYCDEDANVFLIPPEKAEGMESNYIEYLNITKITERANPYCVDVDKKLRIEKGLYDRSVVIS